MPLAEPNSPGWAIMALAQLDRLQHLSLNYENACLITQADLKALGHMTGLRTLHCLLACDFDMNGLPNEVQYSSLSFLETSPVQDLWLPFVSSALHDLPRLQSLEKLWLYAEYLSEESLMIPATLSSLSSLKSLTLGQEGNCMDLSGVLHGLATIPQLTTLQLLGVRLADSASWDLLPQVSRNRCL